MLYPITYDSYIYIGGGIMFFNNKTKKVVILGLNEISLNLARRLSSKYDIVIVAEESQVELDNTYDADVLVETMDNGLVASLKNVGIKETDFFISLTKYNEYNLFSAQLARKMGAKKTIALTNEIEYIDLLPELDLVFNPLQILIDQIQTIIKDTRLLKIKELIPGKINLTRMVLEKDDPLSYIKIKNTNFENGLILAIDRGDKMILPNSDITLEPGDILYIIFKKKMLKNLLKVFRKNRSKNRVFIFGGGLLGFTLANYWENVFENIILIEPDIDRCNYLAEKMEKPLILKGEGTDLELLKEEGLNKNSIFISVSTNDLHNLLSSYTAKKLGCKNVITLLYHPPHKEISRLLNLSNVFTLADLTGEYLNDFLRKGVNFNKHILGKQINATIINIKSESEIVDKKIIDINIPKGIVIGLIVRGKEIIIPNGENRIKDGDRLYIFYYNYLESKLKYFL